MCARRYHFGDGPVPRLLASVIHSLPTGLVILGLEIFIGIIGNWRSRTFGPAVVKAFRQNQEFTVASFFLPFDDESCRRHG